MEVKVQRAQQETAMTIATTHTVRLHRVLASTPEKVYRAFLEPDALARWVPPNGFIGKVHQMDVKVGGVHRMSFTNFGSGKHIFFGGKYLELVPHERIRYTDAFDDPNLPGEMQITVTLKKVLVGTEVHITQEGVPAVIPVEACYLGWQESLQNLARLVEPVIPD
jgi:uncharacterized protein YndB with AHSA1/START domain